MYNVVIYSSNGKAEFSAAIMILILYNLFILSPNPKTNPYRKHLAFLHFQKKHLVHI